MADTQYYGTGRRKSSTARVFLRPGSGNIVVNKRPFLLCTAYRKCFCFFKFYGCIAGGENCWRETEKKKRGGRGRLLAGCAITECHPHEDSCE